MHIKGVPWTFRAAGHSEADRMWHWNKRKNSQSTQIFSLLSHTATEINPKLHDCSFSIYLGPADKQKFGFLKSTGVASLAEAIIRFKPPNICRGSSRQCKKSKKFQGLFAIENNVQKHGCYYLLRLQCSDFINICCRILYCIPPHLYVKPTTYHIACSVFQQGCDVVF